MYFYGLTLLEPRTIVKCVMWVKLWRCSALQYRFCEQNNIELSGRNICTLLCCLSFPRLGWHLENIYFFLSTNIQLIELLFRLGLLIFFSLASVTKRAFRWIHCSEFKNLYITIYNTHVLIKYKICLGILGSISIESRCASYRANHNFT